MYRNPPLTTLAASRRSFQAMPAPKPIAPPSKPNANTLPIDLSRLPGHALKIPMQTPRAAGFNALCMDSLRNGVRCLPLRNASRPERAPSRPEITSFRPCRTSDLVHSRRSIMSASMSGQSYTHGSLHHGCWSVSVPFITLICDLRPLRIPKLPHLFWQHVTSDCDKAEQRSRRSGLAQGMAFAKTVSRLPVHPGTNLPSRAWARQLGESVSRGAVLFHTALRT